MSVPVSGKFVHVHDLFPDGGVESGAAQVAELDTCRAVDVAPSVDDTATLVVTASPDGKASVFHWYARVRCAVWWILWKWPCASEHVGHSHSLLFA